MEKGLKNLQSMARAAHKRSVTGNRANQRGNNEDHEGDSGIGYSDEDAEMEVGEGGNEMSDAPNLRPLQPVQPISNQPERHARPPLPLYQPPLSALERGPNSSRQHLDAIMSVGPPFNREQHSRTPDEHVQRGVSIRSMLSHPEGMPGT